MIREIFAHWLNLNRHTIIVMSNMSTGHFFKNTFTCWVSVCVSVLLFSKLGHNLELHRIKITDTVWFKLVYFDIA